MTTQQIYFIADGFQALDLFGPQEAFMETNFSVPNAYQSKLLSIEAGSVHTAYGHTVKAEIGLTDDFHVDDLILCGGSGMRQLTLSVKQLTQLRAIANKATRVISICTGAFILAQLYPNDALKLTTHWRHCQRLAQRFPNAEVDSAPLFIRSGNKWSSAGVLSGVDLALAIIRLDHGNTIAAQVARELVVYVQRSGSQHQFSEMLRSQSGESLKLSPLLDWLTEQVDRAVSVAEMADQASVSERQLTRLFKQHLNYTPSAYFRQLKLNYARDLLSNENISMENVAIKVGFTSYDSFRRAFVNQFSISPAVYAQQSNTNQQ